MECERLGRCVRWVLERGGGEHTPGVWRKKLLCEGIKAGRPTAGDRQGRCCIPEPPPTPPRLATPQYLTFMCHQPLLNRIQLIVLSVIFLANVIVIMKIL